jgi:hypothetical protein
MEKALFPQKHDIQTKSAYNNPTIFVQPLKFNQRLMTFRLLLLGPELRLVRLCLSVEGVTQRLA